MKKISYTFVILVMAHAIAIAQTSINKSFTVQSGQKILLHFDQPEMIRISTWDKNEISVQGLVSINDGENDNAFELIGTTNGNTVIVKNNIRDFKNLPHRITITRDGQTMVFHDKGALKKYQDEHGASFDNKSWGVTMEIILEIKVPRNIETRIESIYGMVEVKDFVGPISVVSTYGGVDAALKEKTMGELIAETYYGQIYSNLDVRFGNSKEENFHTYVSAAPGNGPRYSFESKYGNVYLRKSP